jgi:hypothetical protein
VEGRELLTGSYKVTYSYSVGSKRQPESTATGGESKMPVISYLSLFTRALALERSLFVRTCGYSRLKSMGSRCSRSNILLLSMTVQIMTNLTGWRACGGLFACT